MEEFEKQVSQNKSVRGYIIRSLVRGYNDTLFCKQISNSLMGSNMIINPDIGEYLKYLHDKGYIEFTDKKIKSINAYKNDAAVTLTAKGVDLAEGTIDDPGVDV